jgi:4-aminobutyrate aminotransferase-like enzyme
MELTRAAALGAGIGVGVYCAFALARMALPVAARRTSGLSRTQVLQLRREHLSGGLRPSYAEPVMFLRGRGQYLYDEEGKEFLDAYNNVPHVGHCHPQVVQAVAAQLSEVNTNTRYLHPNIASLAQRLASKFEAPLQVCFFVNSGSEANDLAMRIARVATGRKEIICFENAYHGTTSLVVKVSPTKSYGDGAAMKPKHVMRVPVPDPYRGAYAGQLDAGERYAAQLQAAIGSAGLAAFIHESVQGVGGQIVYPLDYLARAYALVRAAGGVCIADEVQTGFGRTGKYWAYEHYGVTPDIVTLGKPFGNGLPLGAVVTSRALADKFSEVEYFNTFGGNPAAMAAGLAVMDVVDAQQLMEQARVVGALLLARLAALRDKYECVGDVRGLGLFIGVELVASRAAKTPAPRLTRLLVESLKTEHRILTSLDGPGRNVLRIKPPMCFSIANADRIVDAIDAVLSAHPSEPV